MSEKQEAAAGSSHDRLMGRGQRRDTDIEPTIRRRARTRVAQSLGPSLAHLGPRELYQRGDLAAVLLRKLGVDLPLQMWQRERAQELLGSAYETVAAHGIGAVLDDAGIAPVRSIRERLLDVARGREVSDADLQETALLFAQDAAKTRAAELGWMADNLAVKVPRGSWPEAREERQQWLLDLWFRDA